MWPDWAIFKALGDKISSKRSPTDWQLLGCFEKPHSFVKATLSTLWSTFGKFGLLFDSNVWSQWKQKIKVCYRNWMFSRHTREHLLKGLTNNFCCCFNWQNSNLYLKRADFWKKTFFLWIICSSNFSPFLSLLSRMKSKTCFFCNNHRSSVTFHCKSAHCAVGKCDWKRSEQRQLCIGALYGHDNSSQTLNKGS